MQQQHQSPTATVKKICNKIAVGIASVCAAVASVVAFADAVAPQYEELNDIPGTTQILTNSSAVIDYIYANLGGGGGGGSINTNDVIAIVTNEVKVSQLTNDVGFVTASEASNLVEGSVELTAVYSQTPTYGDTWSGLPAGYWVYGCVAIDEGEWQILVGNGGTPIPEIKVYSVGMPTSFSCQIDGINYTVTRDRTDVIGYYLGDQTNKVLAATNLVGSAAGSIDTNTVMAIVTNAVAAKLAPYPFGEPQFAQTGDWTFSGTSAGEGYHWETYFSLSDNFWILEKVLDSNPTDRTAEAYDSTHSGQPDAVSLVFSYGTALSVTATRSWVCTLAPFANNQVKMGWTIPEFSDETYGGRLLGIHWDPDTDCWVFYFESDGYFVEDATDPSALSVSADISGTTITANRPPSAFTVSVADSPVTNTMRDLWFVVATDTNAPAITWPSEFDKTNGDLTPLANTTNIYHISEYQSGRFAVEVVGSGNGGGAALDTNTVSTIVTNLVTQGWWSEWTILREGSNVTDSVAQPYWQDEVTAWYTFAIEGDGPTTFGHALSGETSEGNDAIGWFAGIDDISYTATRHRIPAQSTSDLINDLGFTTTNDVCNIVTNEVMDSYWTYNPDIPEECKPLYYSNGRWYLADGTGGRMASEDATNIVFDTTDWSGGYAFVATRHFYAKNTLGLVRTNDLTTAIADADTSYARFYALTNINQSVQYIDFIPPDNTLTIVLPFGDATTKDWIIYANIATNVLISLPTNNVWWASDTSVTNDIQANVPTAFYFSQVSTNIFTISRQELQPLN